MFKGGERFMEWFDLLGVEFQEMNDALWVDYSRMVVPLGPVKFDYGISEEEARELLERFPGAILVRHTGGLGGEEPGEGWYAVTCREFKYADELPAKRRSEIKRGLNNCKAEIIDAEYLSRHGYQIYASAYQRYRGLKEPEVSEWYFKQEVLSTKHFDDIVHYWGVFHSQEMIAFAINYIFGDVEVNYNIIKLRPDRLELYPSYALLYRMNEHYLQEMSFEYVNDGFRSLLHQTGVQEFMIKKFNFTKEYTKLEMTLRSPIQLFLQLTYPLRGIAGKVDPRIGAVYEMYGIYRDQA